MIKFPFIEGMPLGGVNKRRCGSGYTLTGAAFFVPKQLLMKSKNRIYRIA